MLTVVTASHLAGRRIVNYLGIVSGEAILRSDAFAGLFSSLANADGEYPDWEETLRRTKQIALERMADWAESIGANAVVGVDLDFVSVGPGTFLVSANGTAVFCDEA